MTQADIAKIMELIPHRYPFLLVDKVIEVVPGETLKALKNVTINEPFFQGHFPGLPVMPGVLQLEALAQAGALYVRHVLEDAGNDMIFLFAGMNKVKFRRPVVPGDQLILNVIYQKHKLGIWRMRGVAEVDGEVTAEGEFTAAVTTRGDM